MRLTVLQILERTIQSGGTFFLVVGLVIFMRDNEGCFQYSDQKDELDEYCFTLNLIAQDGRGRKAIGSFFSCNNSTVASLTLIVNS